MTGDLPQASFVADLVAAGLPPDALLAAVIARTGMDTNEAREMIAIETGESHGDVLVVPDRCPHDLVPFFVRTPAERERWQTCWELSLKMLGGEDTLGTRPMLARQLYASDIPTG